MRTVSKPKRHHVEGVINDAMSEKWDQAKINTLDKALRLKFPRPQDQTIISRIVDVAGDASNERAEVEEGSGSGSDKDWRAYERLASRANRLIKKLPWGKRR